MKTKFLTLATAALLLAACSGQDDLLSNVQQPTTAAEEDMPIGFDTYISSNSQGQTRAAYTSGLFGSTQLKDEDNGFGVFAYLTTEAWTSASSTATPNFMYNQQVTYASSAWTYSPLKYWPNMTQKGDANKSIDGQTGNDAYAETNQLVSFFAYAPYQPMLSDNAGLDGSDGKVYYEEESSKTAKTVGITEIVSSTKEGVPSIKYTMNRDASQSQDLLWGTAPLGGITYTAVNGNTNTIAPGMPLVDMVKPDTHTKMKFLFQHALTALKMDLNLAIDQVSAGGNLADGTTVKVNSITLAPKTPAAGYGFATTGQLSLQNTNANTPAWTTDGTTALTGGKLIIGDTSGETPTANVTINSVLTTGITCTASGEPLTYTYSPALPALVFGSAATDALMFIPVYYSEADFTVTVTIDYDVITTDTHYGSEGKVSVKNTVSKDVVLKSFRAGRLYNLHLVLGLTSVKIDAEAQDWSVDEQTIDLPRNLE